MSIIATQNPIVKTNKVPNPVNDNIMTINPFIKSILSSKNNAIIAENNNIMNQINSILPKYFQQNDRILSILKAKSSMFFVYFV
jgi:hypothetical protein